jgi:hypothetical protein
VALLAAGATEIKYFLWFPDLNPLRTSLLDASKGDSCADFCTKIDGRVLRGSDAHCLSHSSAKNPTFGLLAAIYANISQVSLPQPCGFPLDILRLESPADQR